VSDSSMTQGTRGSRSASRGFKNSAFSGGFFSLVLLILVSGWVAFSQTKDLAKCDLGMSHPAISPDGRTLAFEWRSSIWTVPVEGGEAVLIAPSPERRSSPVWSPDGTSLACIATDPECRAFSVQVLKVAPAGPARESWRTNSEIKGSLDWSPSGEGIALSLGLEEKLAVLSVKGGEPRFLGFSGLHPRWSPDGAFIACKTARNRDLWIIDSTSGKKERLATPVSVNSSFCWSPDGQEIVYESLDRQSVDLWRVSVRGGRAFPLTDDIALEQGPRWHPSNGHIYFSHRRRIWRISKDGGPMEPVPIVCRLLQKAEPVTPVVFKGADVVDVIGGRVLPRQAILVRNGMVEEIGPKLRIPKGAQVIDVSGRFAVPGLLDMHVHYLPWMGPYFLRYGITRIQEMGSSLGPDAILSIGDEIREGSAPGPLIYQSGMILNGSGIAGPPGLGGIQSQDPAVIRKSLEWLLDEGIDVVKIGSENSLETLKEIISLAHSRNSRVFGHISLVPAEEAIRLGQDGIEHPRGLGWAILRPEQRPEPVPRSLPGMLRESSAWRDADPERMRALVRLMVEHRVVWDPTLYIWVVMSSPEGLTNESDYAGLPDWIKTELEAESRSGFQGTWQESDYAAFGAGLPWMRQMVAEFFRQGGLLTAGSDGGIPGASLHHELDELRLAGLTPLDCLRAATINAAKSLKLDKEIGSLEEGKAADIVFVGNNPLQDLGALKDVALTVQRGRIVFLKSRAEKMTPAH